MYLEALYYPSHLIYDIFHNDRNQVVIVAPSERPPYDVHMVGPDGQKRVFERRQCPHNHTYIFLLTADYENTVTLYIDGTTWETPVNKYPVFGDEIVMATLVKDEDEYVPAWIQFHRKLGVQRFIIYDNSDRGTLGEVLKAYIRTGVVVLIRWPYPYMLPKSGISGQTTQQNHAIYAFNTSRYVGLLDIDEYVNLQGWTDLDAFFRHEIDRHALATFGGFMFLSKFFYNSDRVPITPANFFQVVYCDPVRTTSYEKCFVIPQNVRTYSVHAVTDGHPTHTVDATKAYMNHYYFLNKPRRGQERKVLTDDSILHHVAPPSIPSSPSLSMRLHTW